MTHTGIRSALTLLSVLLVSACAQNKPTQTPPNQTSAPAPAGFVQPAPAAACGAALDARFDRPVVRGAFDNALFDAAVLHFTNQTRCAKGIAALSADPGLGQTARIHSADMASRRFFSHTSPVRGRETLGDRLSSGGVQVRGAAENIATRPRLQIGANQPFFIEDAQACRFKSQGRMVQPHSYKSLAQTFVAQWESSAGHRKNLLNPRYTRLGTGGAEQANPKVCGDIVATQNFAS